MERQEGQFHLDHKNDRKKLRVLQKCSNTHFFFLGHIHQIHNGILNMIETAKL